MRDYSQYEYVGGGYVRDIRVPKGKTADIVHTPELLDELTKLQKRVAELEARSKVSESFVDEIIERSGYIDIPCPECGDSCMDDDQYTCTTCWCMGGQGTISLGRFAEYLLGRRDL